MNTDFTDSFFVDIYVYLRNLWPISNLQHDLDCLRVFTFNLGEGISDFA